MLGVGDFPDPSPRGGFPRILTEGGVLLLGGVDLALLQRAEGTVGRMTEHPTNHGRGIRWAP
ncbi:hypothetical protein [Kitasatospora sp. NPDC057738]|uniref:hypothetical protein n=1 Tax=Kitasatospora sp. NPDC057738 TaxID=3346233 RepID=UPI0036BDF15C